MTSTVRATAESRFAALVRREKTAMSEVEAEHQATLEKTARLRALRLAKEAETITDRADRLKQRRTRATPA